MNWTALFAVITAIEAPATPHDAAAAIRREGAYGPVQIRQCALKDVNKYLEHDVLGTFGRRLTLTDCKKKGASMWVCRQYLTYWGREYTKQTGKQPGMEQYLRIWNGGPNGWKRKSTLPYWKKAKEVINARRA